MGAHDLTAQRVVLSEKILGLSITDSPNNEIEQALSIECHSHQEKTVMENKEAETQDAAYHPAGSAAQAADTTNNAVKDTIQKYLNSAGLNVDVRDIEQRIRGRALFSLGIAAGVGFFLGGGLATRPGVIMVGLFARTAARRAAINSRQVLHNAI